MADMTRFQKVVLRSRCRLIHSLLTDLQKIVDRDFPFQFQARFQATITNYSFSITLLSINSLGSISIVRTRTVSYKDCNKPTVHLLMSMSQTSQH